MNMIANPIGFRSRTSGPLWRKIEEQVAAQELARQAEQERKRADQFVRDNYRAVTVIERSREEDLAEPKRMPAREFVAEFARKRGLTYNEIVGPGRAKPVVLVRHEICYILRSQRALTYPQIGRLLNRDHTSALHAVRKHAARNGLRTPL